MEKNHAIRITFKLSQSQREAAAMSTSHLRMTISPAPAKAFKKACQSCSVGKIKCDGNAPCSRCIKQGVDCIYILERKRGRRCGEKLGSGKEARPQATPTVAPLLPQVNVFERRLLRTVFSLFKFHRDDKDMTWFSAQFVQLGTLLLPSIPNFSMFLQQHHINRHQPIMTTPTPSLINLPRFPQKHTHDINLFHLGSIYSDSGGQIACSADITQWLGYATNGNNLPFSCNSNNNVLPWGANVVCSIASEDSQVLKYLRNVALAFQDAPKQPFSLYSEISLLDMPMLIQVVDNARVPQVKCFVSCRIKQNKSNGSHTTRMDLYLDPNPQIPLFALPDLELGPWNDDRDVSKLVEWSRGEYKKV